MGRDSPLARGGAVVAGGRLPGVCTAVTGPSARRWRWRRRPRRHASRAKASSTLTSAQIDALGGQVPGPVGGAGAGGDLPGRGRLSRQRLPGAAVSAQDPAGAGAGLSGGDLRAGRSHAGGLGRLRTADDRPDAAAGLGLRGRALLQPDVLHRVQPLAAEGGLLPGVGPRPGVLSGQSHGKSSSTTSRRRCSAARGGMPVCIPSSWPSAATSAWNRSPARHATRNRKGSSREGCGMSNAVPWRAAARNWSPGRITGVWPRSGATRWPTSACTPPPRNVPSTASRRNAHRLRPLPAMPFDTDEILSVVVTPHARVRYDGNRYSVPPALVRKTVMLRANATRGADRRSGPGSGATPTLLREGPVDRPSRPSPGGLEDCVGVARPASARKSSTPWGRWPASST